MSQESVPVEDDLLTAEEVADWLDVRTSSIFALVARDAIPYVKPRKWWKAAEFRFRRSEVEEWLRSDPSFGADQSEQDADS